MAIRYLTSPRARPAGRRLLALVTAALATGAGALQAQEGIVDQLISDPGMVIVAPEYAPDGKEMSHCYEGHVRIMAMDGSGGLVDPSGASDLVLGECDQLTNGPEWGYIASGPILTWTVPDTGAGYQQLAIASRPWNSADWTEINPIHGSEGVRTPYPVKNQRINQPWTLYSDGQMSNVGMIYKLDRGMPLVAQGKYPTWKPGSLEVVDVEKGSGRLVMMNAASGASRTVSAPAPPGRFNPWVWVAPETGKEVAMVFDYPTSCMQYFDSLGENAEPSRQLCGAEIAEEGVIVTPEPFILRGRSYVSFLLKSSGVDAIYVVGAVDYPGEAPYLAKTSSDEARVRRDPEPVVRGKEASIYYTARTGTKAGGFGVYQTAVLPRPYFPRPPVN